MSKGSNILFPGLSGDSPFSFRKLSDGDRQQRRLPKKKEAEVRKEEVLHDDSKHTLSRRMRSYRDIITSDNRLFVITRYTIYILYLLHVALVAAEVTLLQVDIDGVQVDIDGAKGIVHRASWGSFCAWMILIVLNSTWMIVMGGWQYFAWHGRPVMILHGFQALIFILFMISILYEFSVLYELYFEYALLVIMGFYLFVREQIVLPLTAEQKLTYAGYVSNEHKDNVKDWFKSAKVDDPELYESVTAPQTSKELIESFESAKIDLDISEDVPIQEALKGQDLRASGPPGSIEFQERNDDLVLVIYKLSKLVSFAPNCCRGKTKMTSLQYRNLIRQHIMDLYYPENKQNNNRTLPLSSNETFMLMLRLSMKVPWAYLNSQFPNVLVGIIGPFIAELVGNMINNLTNGDTERATFNFAALMIFQTFLMPLFQYWNAAATATYTAKLGNLIRREMMHGLVNGGTEYGELNGDGSIIDAFSAQLS